MPQHALDVAAAFLHATGSTAEAEGQWEELQNSEDGVGASLYSRSSAIARVRNRWVPCIAN